MSRRDTDGTEVDLHGYTDNIPSEEEDGHLQNDETTNPNGLRIRYFYPRLRYSTLFRGLVLVDALVTVVLWLTGLWSYKSEIVLVCVSVIAGRKIQYCNKGFFPWQL